MLDVVPPEAPSGRAPRSPRQSTGRQSRRVPFAPARAQSSRVVTLQWRLPARLRRPIRQELARARRLREREQSIVRFERRPLYAELPPSRPSYRAERKDSPALVEQHTSDVYKHSRPAVALPIPPYQGRFIRALPRPKQGIDQPQPVVRRPNTAPPRPVVATRRAPGGRVIQARGRALSTRGGPFAFETLVRDVPYQWSQSRPREKTLALNEAERVLSPAVRPQRRFTLPLHFSILPWRRSVRSLNESKKKI